MSEQIYEQKISSDVALSELKGFLKAYKSKDFRRGKLSDEKIKEDYIDVLEAIEDGLLVFEDNSPVYTLRSPIFEGAENPENVIKKVTFRKRIKPADKVRVMDGLDIEIKKGTLTLKMLAYMTKLSITEVDHLEKDDFEVLNQISSVF